MLQMLLGPIANLANTFVEGRVAKSKAKNEVAIAKAKAEAKVMTVAATHSSEWEQLMAANSRDSIKDELWTGLFIIIILANFIPPLQPWVKQGFDNLAACPKWFQWAVSASIAASFGLRGMTKFKK